MFTCNWPYVVYSEEIHPSVRSLFQTASPTFITKANISVDERSKYNFTTQIMQGKLKIFCAHRLSNQLYLFERTMESRRTLIPDSDVSS